MVVGDMAVEAIDYSAMRFWWSVFQWGATLLVALYAWWVGRSRATSQALGELSKRIDDNQRRIEAVEKDISHAPGHQDLGRIHHDISALGRQVSEMNGTLQSMKSPLALMTEHLMARPK